MLDQPPPRRVDTPVKDVIFKVAFLPRERSVVEVPIRPGETLETPLGGRLRIIQKKRGYRYSIDAILLAHFCRLERGDHVIDLGTGNGIIPLLLALRGLADRIVGVEIQDELIDLARRNVRINHMAERISLIHCDVKGLPDRFEAGSFQVAITNPPYRPVRTGRINPNPEKAIARHEILGSLASMAQVASFLLIQRGRFHVIYPAFRMVDMLSILRETGLEPRRIQIVHAKPGEEARFVLAEAVKGGPRELQIVKPVFLHRSNGEHTVDMERIYSGLEG